MTDTKLRELERRWKESNAAEDEAAYLLERVRIGDLEKEKLELAAYCGHEGARLAVDPHTLAEDELVVLERVFQSLSRRDAVRLAADFAERVLDKWTAVNPADDRPRRAIEAALNESNSSQQTLVQAAQQASAAAQAAREQAYPAVGGRERAAEIAQSAARAAALVAYSAAYPEAENELQVCHSVLQVRIDGGEDRELELRWQLLRGASYLLQRDH